MPASILQDITYGFRQLRRSPGFAITAALSLALGIGANAAIFQLVDAIRLKLLPVRNPQELAMIDFEKGSHRSGNFSSRSANLTYAQYDAIRTQQQAFTGVLGWSAHRFNLAPGGEARFAEGLYVSGNFFALLGVNPLIGHTFTAQDDTAACPDPGAVLSYGFWQREFDGDPAALGRTVSLDGHPIPIIGVTPPAFFGVEVGNRYEVAVPLCADRLLSDDGIGRIPARDKWWLSMMGRLNPVSPPSEPPPSFTRFPPPSCRPRWARLPGPITSGTISRTNSAPVKPPLANRICAANTSGPYGCSWPLPDWCC